MREEDRGRGKEGERLGERQWRQVMRVIPEWGGDIFYIIPINAYLVFQEYEETCLFIIARFSASESLRVYINILKIPPPFASRTDIPLVGFATRAWARESATHCLILILLAQREDVFISAHVFLYLFLPLFLYLVILFFNYYFYSDIITL